MNRITPEELLARFGLSAHVENGAFVEVNYEHLGEDRASSGAIYYYVSKDENTKFHRIDCDEYWIYNLGSPLEMVLISPEGTITTKKLGVEEGCQPLIHLPKGTIFASRRFRTETEGTFLTCITVPRYMDEGFELFEDEQMKEMYPELIGIYY